MSERAVHGDGEGKTMKPPLYPQLKPIGFEDMGFIKDMIRRFPSEACEMSPGNIFCWRHFERSKYTLINGNLCILCLPQDEPAYFLQPLGRLRMEETVRVCLSAAPRLSRISRSFASQYGSRYSCTPDRDRFDYVYLARDLTELSGKKYDGKRNRIRKFERTHTFRYVRLSASHVGACRELLSIWFEEKKKEGKEGEWKDIQMGVIQESLECMVSLGVVGGAIEVDGRIAAFSLGEELNLETAVIHIEIVHPAYEGLSQLMNREFVKNEWSAYTYINREEDLGLAGLRRAKSSYHPHHLVEKYDIWG